MNNYVFVIIYNAVYILFIYECINIFVDILVTDAALIRLIMRLLIVHCIRIGYQDNIT